MNIISFLLENIYWVIVVGGVLYSMFGRNRSKARTNRMPSFGGGNDPNRESRQETHWEEEEAESVEPARPIAARPPSEPSQPEVIASYERSSQAPARRPEPPRARMAYARPDFIAPLPESPKEAATLSPKVEEMRKAVVWAEILGPPRSKRPFGK
ncbi:hypothetical protein PALU110988_02285 [Paenibacillus lupini]|uniref:hypothetical protein n=1 Tax=Paenibacillus lupini TaxID=1450204 RepID=UPI001421A6FC|nr:hypothetical protein [Paenibacillus lupini]NIK20928.1 hypothetical protein [Paenibacillus lupini]